MLDTKLLLAGMYPRYIITIDKDTNAPALHKYLVSRSDFKATANVFSSHWTYHTKFRDIVFFGGSK